MDEQAKSDAWVALPSEAQVRADMPAGAKTPYDFEFLPNMTRLLMAHPRLGLSFRRHFSEVMFKPGVLSRQEKELVAAVTAAAQDCHY
jgi:alkylhydroperoxidase/carboxymuconolactone decarboxylase family protein YurZ